MFSGIQLSHRSGNLIGTHQKVDRLARDNLTKLGVEKTDFPLKKIILRFEGRNGPDGIKTKSPAQNEPWHYIDPFDESDTELLDIIDSHTDDLIQALSEKDEVSSAFHAAWLAHAIVDGLTPAHHFPYEEELERLTGGAIEQRTSYTKKLIMPGETISKMLKNNWDMWGVSGLLSRHQVFETGITFILAPLRMNKSLPSKTELKKIEKLGVREYFIRNARQVAMLETYERFYEKGWTNKLVRDVRNELGPTMVRCVTTIWYYCYQESKK